MIQKITPPNYLAMAMKILFATGMYNNVTTLEGLDVYIPS